MIIRVKGDIHGNLAGGHHQRHNHTDTISGILANPILTSFGGEGGKAFNIAS